jgi:hypothetical protein
LNTELVGLDNPVSRVITFCRDGLSLSLRIQPVAQPD